MYSAILRSRLLSLWNALTLKLYDLANRCRSCSHRCSRRRSWKTPRSRAAISILGPEGPKKKRVAVFTLCKRMEVTALARGYRRLVLRSSVVRPSSVVGSSVVGRLWSVVGHGPSIVGHRTSGSGAAPPPPLDSSTNMCRRPRELFFYGVGCDTWPLVL